MSDIKTIAVSQDTTIIVDNTGIRVVLAGQAVGGGAVADGVLRCDAVQSASLQDIEDGLGTASAISVSTGGAKVTGDFEITGSLTATETVPPGGTTGQALTKASGSDYDLAWAALGATDPMVADAWQGATQPNNIARWYDDGSSWWLSLVNDGATEGSGQLTCGRVQVGGIAGPCLAASGTEIQAQALTGSLTSLRASGLIAQTAGVVAHGIIYKADSGVHFLWGAGSPEGVLAYKPGSIYLDTTGGAGTTLYVKETGAGNTGWVAK